jgi:3-hydroxymyristoyl/3-hydroxydecanoyl-(acyl carrier protein) dehydratase
MQDTGALAEVVIAADEARATLRRDHVAELCRGHFPGEPLVPGATLVGIMAELASRLLGVPDESPREVVRAVFLRRVVPQDGIVVAATRHGRRVDVEVRVADAPAARGEFRFAEPA